MPALYLILIVSCFSSATIFVKIYQTNAGADRFPTAYFNLVYGGASFLFLLCLKGFRLEYSLPLLLLAAGVGVSLLIYNGIKIKAVSLGPVALVSMSYVLGGIFIPSFFGILFLREPLTVAKGVALALFVLSFLPILLTQKGTMKLSVKLIACCAVLLCLNGVILTMSKVAQLLLAAPQNALDYIALYSFFCLIAALANVAPSSKQVQPQDLAAICTVRHFVIIAFASLFNAWGSILNITVQYQLPASVTFPVVQAGVLMVNTIASLILYREKPNKPIVASLVILCTGIVVISI